MELIEGVALESPPPVRIYFADESSLKRSGLTRAEVAEVRAVRAQLAPRAAPYLKYAFVGPRSLFALFVTVADVPPDYGPDSIVLNDCHAAAKCPHMCGTRFEYAEDALIPLGPSGYACEEAWYWRDD